MPCTKYLKASASLAGCKRKGETAQSVARGGHVELSAWSLPLRSSPRKEGHHVLTGQCVRVKERRRGNYKNLNELRLGRRSLSQSWGSSVKVHVPSEPVSAPVKYGQSATPTPEGFCEEDCVRYVMCPHSIYNAMASASRAAHRAKGFVTLSHFLLTTALRG